jgi:hypothetical protein
MALKGGEMRSVLAILMAAFIVGSFAATASAQSPTQDAYGGVLGEQVGDDGPSGPQQASAGEAVAVSNAQAGGSLPLTGLDLAVVVLIGASLVGLGVGLRWTTRRTPA